MGTTYTVKVYDSPQKTKIKKISIDSVLVHLNSVLSTYISSSEISMFNKNISTDEIKVSDILFDNVEAAYKIYNQSQGLYDVTVYPLVELWGFGKNRSIASVPSDKAIYKTKEQVGMDKIILNKKNRSIQKLNPLVGIDLSSIAKGYAVDYVSNFLIFEGYDNHMVEIGGEVRCMGLNNGNKWSVAIVDPTSTAFIDTLFITNQSVATSGNYNNFYTINGNVYTHIISPITGYPIKKSPVSVTVISKNCAIADGYATALMVTGLKGIDMINMNKHTDCMIIMDKEGSNEYHYSKSFNKE